MKMKPKKMRPKKMKPKKLKTNKRAKAGMRKKIDMNSVKWKVMVPTTMLGAMLLICGILCIGQLRGMLRSSQTISDRYAQNTTKLGEIAEDFQSLHRVIYEHCLTSDSASLENLSTEASTLRSNIQTANIEYEEMMGKGSETEKFQKFEQDYEEYLTNFEQAIRLSNKGRKDDAQNLANGTLSTLGSDLSNQISELIQYNKKGMDSAIVKQKRKYNSSLFIVAILLILGIIVDVLGVTISHRCISLPLGRIDGKLSKIVDDVQSGHGDLTERISVDSRDEMGKIAKGINVFLEALQTIMKEITTSAASLDEIVGKVSDHVATANDSSADISALMQQLAASMQEISSTISNISENATDVNGNVIELANASGDLQQYAAEMRVRAEKLESTAVETKKNTSVVVNNIQNINQVVVGAVEELTEQARAIASYIMENISTDYDDFVASGAQYKEDAVHVDEIVTRFHRMADEAQVLVDNITRAIQGISAAVDESANGVGSAATNTADLVQGIGSISAQMKENKEIAEKLNDEAGKFERV